MRKRNNQNSLILAYKYWAQPLTEPPGYLWLLARESLRFWNEMVSAHRQALMDAHDAESEIKKQIWTALEGSLREIAKRARQELNWEIGNDLYDRFKATMRRFVKQKKGLCVPQEDELFVAIPHQFTSALDPERLFGEKMSRLRFEPIERHSTRVCHFGLKRDLYFPLMLRWHRDLPHDARIKTARLCGRRNANRQWQWALVLTCEIAAPIPSRNPRVATITLAPSLDGDTIFLGTVRDNRGDETVLRLPLCMSTTHTRRHGLPASVSEIDVMRRRADESRDEKDAMRLRSIAAAQSGRLIRRRQWYYRNIASYLARVCGTIQIVDQSGDAEAGVKRQAAVRELVSFIEQSGRKAGITVESSQICGNFEQSRPLRRATKQTVAKSCFPPPFLVAVAQHVQPG